MLIPVSVLGGGDAAIEQQTATLQLALEETHTFDLAGVGLAQLGYTLTAFDPDGVTVGVNNSGEIYVGPTAVQTSASGVDDWTSVSPVVYFNSSLMAEGQAGWSAFLCRRFLRVTFAVADAYTGAAYEGGEGDPTATVELTASLTFGQLGSGTGPTGLTGPSGSQGAVGSQGPQGEQGEVGPSGAAPGVVLRESARVGDATETINTDGIVTASGVADMVFNGTSGLFRLRDGTGVFHDYQAWALAPGDGTDKVVFIYLGPPDDGGATPAIAGYRTSTVVPVAEADDFLLALRGPDNPKVCVVARIDVPNFAVRSDECVITDLRVFVA